MAISIKQLAWIVCDIVLAHGQGARRGDPLSLCENQPRPRCGQSSFTELPASARPLWCSQPKPRRPLGLLLDVSPSWKGVEQKNNELTRNYLALQYFRVLVQSAPKSRAPHLRVPHHTQPMQHSTALLIDHCTSMIRHRTTLSRVHTIILSSRFVYMGTQLLYLARKYE